MMLYLVGSIMGAASYGPLRARIGGRRSLRSAARCSRSARSVARSPPAIGQLLVARLFQGIGGGLILAGRWPSPACCSGRGCAATRSR